jgi:vanillate O-demethylase monooxygenase subunit
MTYLRNAWYMAGFADELQPGRLLARTLLEQPLVFFLDAQGAPAALLDRCPHRFAPLSAGKLVDDGRAIECPYHGLRFDAGGRCVANPHGDRAIPKAAAVQAHAVRARDGFLWWWAGDAAQADESLIPDYSHVAGVPADGSIRGYLPTACDYRLLVDNILDLTHADYLHAGSLGNGSLTRTPPLVDDLGPRSARITWLTSGELAPPAFDMHLRRHGEPTDQWTSVTWSAPSNMLLRVGATLLGEPREQGMEAMTCHIATPEGPGRCHYWYWATRHFALNPHANEAIAKLIHHAFSQQDKPMLEAQQQRMGEAEFWSLKPVLLPGDAGAVRVRRKLGALIEGQPGGLE